MNQEILIGAITIIVGLLLSVIFIKFWIRVGRAVGLVGQDLNKESRPAITESGGVPVLMSFTFTILLFVFFRTFILVSDGAQEFIFSLLLSSLLAGFIGFMDDILGWKAGLKQWQKPLLTIPVAIPLIVINAGVSEMVLPLFGRVELGLLYPLIFIPIGIVGASNGFNMLAGYNGLEAGMGIIILSTLGYVTFMLGHLWLALVTFSIVAVLIGFFFFNSYPAKIFPGDSFTYSIGSLIAIVAILGNVEKIAVILFFPYCIEFLLKLRSKFKAEVFGEVDKTGGLRLRGKKVFSLTHVVLRYFPRLFKRTPREYEVVVLIFFFELIFVALSLSTFTV